jgi:hypothetical protein
VINKKKGVDHDEPDDGADTPRGWSGGQQPRESGRYPASLSEFNGFVWGARAGIRFVGAAGLSIFIKEIFGNVVEHLLAETHR